MSERSGKHAANPERPSAPSSDPLRFFAPYGIEELAQIPLLFPVGYADCSASVPSVDTLPEGEPAVIVLQRDGEPRTLSGRFGPRTTCMARDPSGQRVGIHWLGEAAAFVPALDEGRPVLALARTESHGRTVQLQRIVPPAWLGAVLPRYPVRPKGPTSLELAARIRNVLPRAIESAAAYVEQRLAPYAPMAEWMAAVGKARQHPQDLLRQVHEPDTLATAEAALAAARTLAAVAALAKVEGHAGSPARPWRLETIGKRARALPYEPTDEQRAAIADISAALALPAAMRHLLIGDVGCGKTTVFGVVAAALADAGGRTAILVPTAPLAGQIADELGGSWPDLGIACVAGDSLPGTEREARVVVGTTALLHRDPGAFDLVVVDEEQKFGTDQKAALVPSGVHRLTVSATPLPRSLALGRYGAMGVSELRRQHVHKQIRKHLWPSIDRGKLWAELAAYLADPAQQLLVVYPRREGAPDDALRAARQAAQLWEKHAPGKVRVLTGEDPDEDKLRALADMRAGTARILVSTTAVEVGVTLPALRRALVIDPQQHGLMTLHQLYGRVARKGGAGWFDLLPLTPLTSAQKAKLTRFLRCRDGFEVAALDLALRGAGDLGVKGRAQSGADRDLMFGQALRPEELEAAAPVWAALRIGAYRRI